MLGTLLKAGSSLIGGLLQGKQADKNIKLQKQFAQKGIQWKVADSLKAGIHPLYGLGANTISFSPVPVGGGLGGAISDMGQDISRAIDAGGTTEDRVLRKLQLERAGLENELLKSQIATARSAQIGPGSPVGANQPLPGQGIPDVFLPGIGKLRGNPKLSSGQDIENAYGDASSGLALVNLMNAFVDQLPGANPGLWPQMLRDAWNRRVSIGRSRMPVRR